MYRRWIVTSLEHHVRPLVQWIEFRASNPEMGVRSSQGRPINVVPSIVVAQLSVKQLERVRSQYPLPINQTVIQLINII